MEIRTISEELKRKYGTKVYRLSLTSGCTCPNRDGRAGYGGCTFCSEGGSGDFASPFLSVPDQIQYAKTAVSGKISSRIPESERKYIAYFQSFTNTYGDPERLCALYEDALKAVREDSKDKRCSLAFAKFYDIRTVTKAEGRETVPYGVFVDVFPVDDVPDDMDSFKRYKKYKLYKKYRKLYKEY